MLLTNIKSLSSVIDKLSIHSFEQSIYLVEIVTEGYVGLIRGKDGNAQRFKSVQDVKNQFEDIDVKQAELIHESSYDEMIGGPPKGTNKMVLPIQF